MSLQSQNAAHLKRGRALLLRIAPSRRAYEVARREASVIGQQRAANPDEACYQLFRTLNRRIETYEETVNASDGLAQDVFIDIFLGLHDVVDLVNTGAVRGQAQRAAQMLFSVHKVMLRRRSLMKSFSQNAAILAGVLQTCLPPTAHCRDGMKRIIQQKHG
ncbi:MAG: hypothetical protein AB7G06_03450 [Bdellovibrionales bacterium]